MLLHIEKNNPEKKGTCFHLLKRQDQNFVRSLKTISLTNTAVKQKAIEIVKKAPKINKIKDVILEKDNDLTSDYLRQKIS